MLCNTWNHLYEQYERIALNRLQSHRTMGVHMTDRKMDAMNTAIAEALRALREHERQHGCH
ncbi:MAG TPA: hypothetical protein VN577_22455 [Terriglobales bacterium]|nr:hypothetical protein [Terriglobales bacterium]